MGKQSSTDPRRRPGRRVFGLELGVLCALLAIGLAAGLAAGLPAAAQAPPAATTVPLILPAGLVYDAAGNLLFAESGRHVIRRVSVAGELSTVAGTGTQGFAGDGGQATAAVLDTPTALALDGAGDLFFADSHNHRIRRIDAGTGTVTSVASGVSPAALAVDVHGNLFFADSLTHQVRKVAATTGAVSTLAGNGIQGFSGDGGPALEASLDSPTGLAVTAAGDLLLADTHNHRIRRVDAGSGVITTLTTAASLPRGMVVDSAGGLLFADVGLQKVLRIDATGAVSVVAGAGVQSFAGDGGAAALALLDSPRAVTLSPAGLPTLADSANGRIRQVDATGVIHTLAGIGTTSSAVLSLTGPSVLLYGSGAVAARLAASPATGSVTLFDSEAQATPQSLGSAALVGNAASFATMTLGAGAHRLFATYSGDTLHPSAESSALSLLVSPATVSVAPASFSIVYGQPAPTLSGTLVGVLAQDAGGVSLRLASGAAALAAPGVYPITAALAGPAAGNYTLAAAPASVTIAKAPVTIALDASRAPSLRVQVGSTTAGLPTGGVTLLDGATAFASGTLSAGAITLSSANLSAGSHTLTASYAGDADFLPAVSTPSVVTIAASALPDFTMGPNGQTSVTVPTGTAAQYGFTVTPVNGGLASPILLTAAGLPPGATASFNPADLPPSSGPVAFVLTVSTTKAALARRSSPFDLAFLLPLVLLARRRARRTLGLLAITLLMGCGDRINNFGETPATAAYTITVTATATQSTGAVVQHSTTVTLNLQK